MPRFKVRNQKSLVFDGSTTGVTIPIVPSTSGFSLMFWYTPRTHVSNNRILDYQEGGPAKGFTIIQSTTNGKYSLQFRCNNNGGQTADIFLANYEKNKKVHIAIVHNGTSVTSYLNGSQVGTDSTAAFTNSTATLTLGKRATGATNYFNGSIADFVFVNGETITQTEIQNHYYSGVVPTSATLQYIFEGDASDKVGTNDGTVTGGVYERFSQERKSMHGSSCSLNFQNVSTAVLTVADTENLRVETNATFSWSANVYIKNRSENVLPRIVGKGAHYLCFMGDQTNGQKNRLAIELADENGSGSVEYWGSTRLQENEWYNVTAVIDNGVATLFIDGIEEVMTTLLGPYSEPIGSTSGSDLLIGNSGGGSRNFPGLLKDIQQFNVALTDDEVSQLANGIDVTRGLVGKWNCSEGTGTSVADSTENGYDGTITDATWKSITINRTASTGRIAASGRTAV